MRTWHRWTVLTLLALTIMLAACGGSTASTAPTVAPAIAEQPTDRPTTTSAETPDAVETPAESAASTAATVEMTAEPAATATTGTTATAPASEMTTPDPIVTTVAAVVQSAPVSATADIAAPPQPEARAAVTATHDPWAEYAQYTIEGLRARAYGTGEIEVVQTLEETAHFTRYLIAYPSDGLRLTGMLNRPRGDGPFPVVILNHGYYPLDVYQTGNGTKLAADYLAERGYLTLSPDFRSHAGSDDAPNLFRAGHVIDTLNLIPLAQKLPSAKPGKVGMWGHSNGGAITAKVIAVSDQVGAALIYAPASSNIVEDYQFRVERAKSRGTTIDRVEWPVLPDEAPDLYERLSPLPYLGYVTAPVQIHWGSNDDTVPRKWPEDLFVGLQNAGKNVEWFEYAGEPHSFTAAGNSVYLPRMVEFFDRAIHAR